MPYPTGNTVLTTILVGLAFLLLAVLIELLRRGRERRRQLDWEWRAVAQLVQERGFSEEERAFLRVFLQNHAPKSPHHAVTEQHRFNQCVDADMQAISLLGDQKALEERGSLLRDIRCRLGLDQVPLGLRIQGTRELFRGQPIFVQLEDGEDKMWTRAVVVKVTEAVFHLASHTSNTFPRVKKGARIRCRMWREEDARYLFTVTLIRAEADPETWVIQHTTQLERKQSRAHFRIHYEQDANVEVFNASRDSEGQQVDTNERITQFQAHITSLSGGGIAMITPQAVPRQVVLRLTLTLGPDEEMWETVMGVVVGSQELPREKWLLRIAFTGIDEEMRERISQYVFRQQQPIREAQLESEELTAEHAHDFAS